MDTKQINLNLTQVMTTNRQQKPAAIKTSLIATANNHIVLEAATSANILTHLTQIAESTETLVTVLVENVTALLANIAMKAETGKPINLMHINSVAAFLAGVEAMSNALPISTDEVKKQNTLRVLATAGLEGEQVNDATFPIVSLGAHKRDRHKAFSQLLQAYMKSVTNGEPDGDQVVRVARNLQMRVDKAMRTAMVASGPPTTPK